MNKKEFDQIVHLTQFLETYTQQTMKSDRNKTLSFSEEDKKKWGLFFEMLIKTNVLPDGTAFGEPNNDTNVGIGKDGVFYKDEFLQLLMQCYKYLYRALSSGEVFLKYKNWQIADKTDI